MNKNDQLQANDSARTQHQKELRNAKMIRGKVKKEKVIRTFSPDGGKTVYPFSSQETANERIPQIIERRLHAK